MRFAIFVVLALAAGAGCKKPAALAELTAADGPVDRQAQRADAAWAAAPIGTGFFLGDAARTHDAGATLVIAGVQQLRMHKQTVLRFGGAAGPGKLVVEVGEVEVSGAGGYALDVGDVRLVNGTVRIAARGDGTSRVELVVGQAQVLAGGQDYELTIGRPIDLGGTTVTPVAIDAGVVDAAPPPVIDAAAPPVADATIEVTGKRGEILAPGTTAWRPLAEGAAPIARGAAVRLGPGTTARLTQAGATLALAGGSRARLDDELALWLEAGAATATGAAQIRLPGGALALAPAEPGQPAEGAQEARLDVTPRDAKVTVLRGAGKLTGAPGAELGLARGETAVLTRAGAIHVVEAIPTYFDLRIAAGESFTIHDPRPPTAVQFGFDGKCGDAGGLIEVDRDPRFRTARLSAGRTGANLLLAPGSWSYRLRCTSNGSEGAAVASGRIAVVRDDGRRPLPRTQSNNDIAADGRTYLISYQSAIPNMIIQIKNPGSVNKLHLASGGKEQIFDSSGATITVPGAQLHEGRYTYWLDRDGVKQDKISTLTIDFDQTAPQVYIESPNDGQPWNGDIAVSGAVLPGWSAAVESVTVSVDRQRRFTASVGAPAGNALAIRLSHPQHGVHYYLRRQK